MARKGKSGRSRRARSATTAQGRLLETLHEVWLAGLGAMVKAQRGAPQILEDLISEGARVHAQTRGAAEKALRGLIGNVRSTIDARTEQVRGGASDAMENLEKIFQTRVHRALTRLGVPSAEDVQALSKRVDSLNANIDKLARARKTPRARAGGPKAEPRAPAH